MTPHWRERLRMWVCSKIGHRPYGPRLLDGSRWCERCGRLAT